MKTCSNRTLPEWLTNRRNRWWIISLICLLAGTYFVGHHFGLLAIVVLGLAGLLIGGAARAFVNWNKVNREQRAPAKRSLPQITLGWDYRPRAVIRRDTPIDLAAAETAEVLSSSPSAPNENDNVWFNFTNAELTVGEGTIKASSGDNEGAVAAYD